ncbi:type III pantothenate kinase [Herbaspirillum sp. ST 5-3]|uniref:type III pantothenate kinase n=1 Tax=Oxalobacteraceae TaxID=75682 RepID=UPI0010A57DBA|nr:type III pantothenate kinase [Herbaspirillum sp. ST 5-3]
MLLLIDAGNTRVKWALVPNSARGAKELGRWTECGMVEHAQLKLLCEAWRGQKVVRVLISNVAGQNMRAALEQTLLGAFGMHPVPVEWFSSSESMAGVQNNYRNPQQLGCDRFASAIGAHALFPGQALIVATCGTATTVDAITAEGVFLGGMILPGLGLMASSLAKNTAQLPQVAQDLDIAEPFADHTDAAIVSGCLAAQTGAIERAVGAHERRHGAGQCILSGGAAALIAPHLTVPHVQVDNLVLIGLHAVAMQ